MGAEHHRLPKENLGVIEHNIGPTIIIASFLNTHSDPRGEHPNIDIATKRTGVWLTTPHMIQDELYDFIIGPDGLASCIAVRRNDGKPVIVQGFSTDSISVSLVKDVESHDNATFTNIPEGEGTQSVVSKWYKRDGFVESYTVLTLPISPSDNPVNSFSPYAERKNLISGMNNRGFLRLVPNMAWPLRNTDKSELPFGRELGKH